MSFLGLNLNPRSLVAGFAKRDVELRDKARDESMELVKDTMNYRAELAIRKKREGEEALKSDVTLGKNLVKNFGFDVGQVGVLASQGKLQQVLNLYEKAQEANIPLPDPTDIVTVTEEMPADMPIEEYLRKIKIGTVVSPTSQRDLGLKSPVKKDRFFDLTGFDPMAQAEQYGERYAQQLGMTPGEITAYAFDDLERLTPEGQVNLSPFAPLGQTNIDTDIRAISKTAGKIAAGTLGLEDVYDIYDNYKPRMTRSVNDRAHGILMGEISKEVGERLRAGEKYEDIERDLTLRLSTADGINEMYRRSQPDAEPLTIAEIGTTDGTIEVKTDFDYTSDQISAIQNAQTAADLAKIADQISKQSGGGPEAERIKVILRDSAQYPNIEDKIRAILQQDNATAQVAEPSASDTQIAANVTGVDESTIMSEIEQEQPEVNQEVATAVTELQKAGIDTTDVVAVRNALAEVSKEFYEPGMQRFAGSKEEYDVMFNNELDQLAKQVTESSRAVA